MLIAPPLRARRRAQSGRPASPPSSPRVRTCPGARRRRGSGALSSARAPPRGVSPSRGSR
eukprot:5270627-Alexandrium_andersonii.AAC.1